MRNLIIFALLLLSSGSFAQPYFSKVYDHKNPTSFFSVGFGVGIPIFPMSDPGYMLSYAYYPPAPFADPPAMTQLVRTNAQLVPKWRMDLYGLCARPVPLANGACLVWSATDNYTHLEKVDSSGNVVWCKNIMWDSSDGFRAESGVYNGSKIRLAGYTFKWGSSATYDTTTSVYIDIDTAGNILGGKTYLMPTGASPYSWFTSLSLDAAGNYIFAGSLGNPQFVMKMSPTDSVIWCKGIETTTSYPVISTTLTLHGGSILFGGMFPHPSTAGYKPMIGMLSSSGSLLWAKEFDASLQSRFYFQQLPSGKILASIESRLMEMDTAGNILWARHYGGKINALSVAYLKSDNDWYFTSITKDSFSLVVFNTDSTGVGHCPPTDDIFTLSNVVLTVVNDSGVLAATTFHSVAGVPDTAVTQLYIDTCAGYFDPISPINVEYVQHANEQITLYPNPATSELNIVSTDEIRSITICNVLGKVVYSKQLNTFKATIDIAYLPAGVYFLRVNGRDVKRFVKG